MVCWRFAPDSFRRPLTIRLLALTKPPAVLVLRGKLECGPNFNPYRVSHAVFHAQSRLEGPPTLPCNPSAAATALARPQPLAQASRGPIIARVFCPLEPSPISPLQSFNCMPEPLNSQPENQHSVEGRARTKTNFAPRGH